MDLPDPCICQSITLIILKNRLVRLLFLYIDPLSFPCFNRINSIFIRYITLIPCYGHFAAIRRESNAQLTALFRIDAKFYDLALFFSADTRKAPIARRLSNDTSDQAAGIAGNTRTIPVWL